MKVTIETKITSEFEINLTVEELDVCTAAIRQARKALKDAELTQTKEFVINTSSPNFNKEEYLKCYNEQMKKEKTE